MHTCNHRRCRLTMHSYAMLCLHCLVVGWSYQLSSAAKEWWFSKSMGQNHVKPCSSHSNSWLFWMFIPPKYETMGLPLQLGSNHLSILYTLSLYIYNIEGNTSKPFPVAWKPPDRWARTLAAPRGSLWWGRPLHGSLQELAAKHLPNRMLDWNPRRSLEIRVSEKWPPSGC